MNKWEVKTMLESEGYTVKEFVATKNNNVKQEGFNVFKGETPVGVVIPCFYWENFNEDLTSEEVVKHIKYIVEGEQPKLDLDLSYGNVASKIKMLLVSEENVNENLVYDHCFEDIFCHYYIDLSNGYTIKIDKRLKEREYSEVNLYEVAKKNMKMDYCIEPLIDIMRKRYGDFPLPPFDIGLNVLSSSDHLFGASRVLVTDLEDGTVVIPSSIHEVLLLENSEYHDADVLLEMVKAINSTTVEPTEKLSDNVYIVRDGNLVEYREVA